MGSTGSISSQDAKYCLNQLQQDSPDLYLASLLLPAEFRASIVTLHAFHTEISGITLAAPEPIAGEIRLQWWMDVFNGQRNDEAAQHPLARSLMSVLDAYDLPADVLVAKLEAHIFDLYSDPMGERAVLEAYLGETRSIIFQLAAMIVDNDAGSSTADASGHCGVATGCLAILENLARHRAQQRVYFPSDLLAGAGLNAEKFLSGPDMRHQEAVLALAEMADFHYVEAVKAVGKLPPELKPVFSSLALVPVYLRRIQAQPDSTLTGLRPVSQLRRQWALWRG